MAIQRWDPVRDLLRLQERVNDLFEDVKARSGSLHETAAAATATWKPPMDLFEGSGHWTIRVDLPGVDPADVGIDIESDVLLIRGERRADPSVARESYLRAERPLGRFVLHVALPSAIDRAAMSAVQRDGVLEVSLPKKLDERPARLRVEKR